MQPNKRLEFLNMEYNDIQLLVGPMFDTSHYASTIGVENLVMDGNKFKKGAYSKLQNMLTMMTPLITLSIRNCLIEDAGA